MEVENNLFTGVCPLTGGGSILCSPSCTTPRPPPPPPHLLDISAQELSERLLRWRRRSVLLKGIIPEYSPSLDMPTEMHFLRRQYWQRLRFTLMILHCWFLRHGRYWIFCWILLLKKPCWSARRKLYKFIDFSHPAFYIIFVVFFPLFYLFFTYLESTTLQLYFHLGNEFQHSIAKILLQISVFETQW